MQARGSLVVCFAAFILLATAPRLHAQDLLTAVRELYASAEYEDALTMLDGLDGGDFSREDRRSMELYRTLCLLATGRRADADRAMEAMVMQDPLFRPSGDEIPPRMRAALSELRKRILPPLIQQQYVQAKTAFDRQDFQGAANGFKQVLEALSDPDVAPVAAQPPLSDVRTLAGGFYELSAKSAEPPPPPPAPAPAPEIVAPQPPRHYTATDRNVVPPVTIKQSIPPVGGRITGAGNGIVEVIIDETGVVESARMYLPLNGAYDKLVVSAAKNWQYQPATVDGVPVKFRKLVRVSVQPTP